MNETISGLIAARNAIQLLGGPVSAARRLGVKGARHQTIQSWLKTRVPAQHCPAIERATGGAVRCEDLRPDVDWAVLRGAATPPATLQEVRDAA